MAVCRSKPQGFAGATASEAVRAAIEIAQRFDAKLVLLSAFQDASDASSARDPELQWAVNPNARVREMLSRTEDDVRKRKIECTSNNLSGTTFDGFASLPIRTITFG